MVSDETALRNAIEADDVEVVKFTKDITLGSTVCITKGIVIDGLDHKLIGTDGRAFLVEGEAINVTIQNVAFNGFTQGTTVNKAGQITIKNNSYNNVHRCMDMEGLTSENVTIADNVFNLGSGKRAVSYPVKATRADIEYILENNTFSGETNPDNLVRYYCGKYANYQVNSPIIDFTDTTENGTIVLTNGVHDADQLGEITITVAEGQEITDAALLEVLSNNKKDFVEQITIDRTDATNVKVMIKSYDGKDTCYYKIVVVSGT